jgi:hypothetical protein
MTDLILICGFSGNMGVLNVGLDQMELIHTLNGGHSDIIRGAVWNPEVRILSC